MTAAASDIEFQNRMRELDGLVQEVDSIADPAARAKMGQIIQGLMDFHGAAVASLFERLGQAGPAGQAIIEAAADDDLTSALLLLYGLHPHDLGTRVRCAVERVRPSLAKMGGGVELVSISDEGAVVVRMETGGHSCQSTAAAMRSSIEQAIYERAPDVASVEILDDAASKGSSGFVPLDRLVASAARNHQLQGAST